MNDQFFLVLPSNSSMNIYPENKTSGYKVQLPHDLNLDVMKWEVGLSEIQLPNTFYNIREGHNTIIKVYKDLVLNDLDVLHKAEKDREKKKKLLDIMELLSNQPENTKVDYYQPISITPGLYQDIDEIIKALMNYERRKNLQKIKYNFDPVTQKVFILSRSEKTQLNFNNSDIGYCFGFDPSEILTDKKTYVSKSITNLNLYQNCYVYTDIIQNQIVGDVKAPLLRVVPIKNGKFTYIHYDKPHFFAINRSNIFTVEVNIRDDRGDFLSFESGTVTVTLLFRRKKAQFFD